MWLECRGHLSEFAIRDHHWMEDDEEHMDVAVADVMPRATLVGELRVRLRQHQRGDGCLKAIADYDQAIALNLDNGTAYSIRRLAQGKAGDYSGAIHDLDLAILNGANDDGTYYNRGNAKQGLGDCDRALNLKPDGSLITLVSVQRGYARAGREEYEGALSDCDRAIGINCHRGQRSTP